MELIESDFTIKLTRAEILALQKGLKELETLQRKYPDERNGYDTTSQGHVSGLLRKLNTLLGNLSI
jgi:hypothetical protein